MSGSGLVTGAPNLTVIEAITQFVGGTQAVWNSVSVPIPAGLAVYAVDTTAIKIGDGTSLYVNLPVALMLSDITTLLSDVQTILSGGGGSGGSGGVTTVEMNNAIAAALTSYTNTAALNTLLNGYITTAELSSALAGILTTADLGTYVTATSLAAALTSYVKATDLSTDLGNYVTTAALEAALNTYVTATQLTTALSGLRRRLTGDLTLYVTTTGSDSSGDGTVGNPFASVQGAWNSAAATLDLNGHQLTISVGAGIFVGPGGTGFTAYGLLVGQNGNPVIVAGSGSGSTILSATATGDNVFVALYGAYLVIENATLYSSTVSVSAIFAALGSSITIGAGIVFGGMHSTGNHMAVSTGGTIYINSSYTVTGGAGVHVSSGWGGLAYLIANSGITITFSGNPTFSVLFMAVDSGGIYFRNTHISFSGAAIGMKYNAMNNGVIDSAGGYTTFPGNTAGYTGTGGICQ